MSVLKSRFFVLFGLILAGELIFSLPFHIPRFFRPSLLEALEISNAELGDAFAIYGLLAMLAYFPGGIIADRFQPRSLMVFSLLATSAGGIFLSTLPSGIAFKALFAYWGITTILLFWGALLKSTSLLGSDHFQGRAFGFLDGGRGLVASIASSVILLIVVHTLPSWLGSESISAKGTIKITSLFYSALTALSAIFIWRFAEARVDKHSREKYSPTSLNSTLIHLKSPEIWLIGGVVICAYCGYKSLDNISLYALDALGMSRTESEQLATWLSYLRAIAAISAGVLADRFHVHRVIQLSFACLIAASLTLGLYQPEFNTSFSLLSLATLNIIVSFWAVYALRGIYFAQVRTANIPVNSTGVAIGLSSALGFMPDIFFAPITGRILDANPGLIGHQYNYLLMALIALIGLCLSAFLSYRRHKQLKKPQVK